MTGAGCVLRGGLPGLVAGLGLLLAPSAVTAHALDPSLLELVEVADAVEVTWRTPVSTLPGFEAPRPVLPCVEVPAGAPSVSPRGLPGELAAEMGLPDSATSTTSEDSRTWIHRWRLDCGAAGLAGRRVAIEGLVPQGAEVLLRWVDAAGRVDQRVLDAGAPALDLPPTPRGAAAWGAYLRLGFEHILGGFDHLAFVLALVLLVPGRRRLVWTLTAFTAGHSVTLALVVTGVVVLPAAAVEAAIAASILLLAAELASSPPGERGLGFFARRPWAMAGLFGLLHGCGFAGALREIGLPSSDVPTALAAFNLGIEVGQIAFVAALWVIAWVAGFLEVAGVAGRAGAVSAASAASEEAHAWPRVRTATVYLVGTLGAYWTLERLGGVLWG